MPAVDYERVLVKMKAHVASKASHGRSELLEKLAEFEVACEVPEGQEGFDPAPMPRHLHRGREHDGDTSQEEGEPALAEA